MTEYSTYYDSDTKAFDEEERQRIKELRAESQAFVESREELHAPVAGGLYRCLRTGTNLITGNIVMVVSKHHYTSNTYTTGNGTITPTELPEWRDLKILVNEKVWPVDGAEDVWYHWFEKVEL